MRTRLLVLLVALALAAASRASEGPLAMLVDVVGPVRIVSEDTELSAERQRPLRLGDVVKLDTGGRATVIYIRGPRAGRLEAMTGPGQARIGPEGSQAGAGVVQARRQPVRPALVPGQNLQEMLAVTTKSLIVPTAERAVTESPIFTWRSILPGPFQVALYRRAGDQKPIWSRRTDDLSLPYDGRPLQKDVRYYWEVSAEGAPPGRSTVRVLSRQTQRLLGEAAEDARAMAVTDPLDPTPHVLLMWAYAGHEMYGEAAASARRALEVRPEDDSLRRALEELLSESGEQAGARELR